jgi:hypothetical protein
VYEYLHLYYVTYHKKRETQRRIRSRVSQINLAPPKATTRRGSRTTP